MKAAKARTGLLLVWAVAYVAFGSLTEIGLVQVKPVPESLLSDFVVYREALIQARDGGDPYAVRYIGPGYFYPPQALLAVELLSLAGQLGFRYMFGAHVLGSLSLVAVTVWGLGWC